MIILLFACSSSKFDSGLSSDDTISVSGNVVGLFGTEGIENVEICLSTEEQVCTTTNQVGFYSLENVPVNQDLYLLLNADDLVKGAIPFASFSNDIELANVSLLSSSIIFSGEMGKLGGSYELVGFGESFVFAMPVTPNGLKG